MIQNKKVLYNHSADKKDENKWKEGSSLKIINLEKLPNYISKNSSKFAKWLD
jgi:hypothetical protein